MHAKNMLTNEEVDARIQGTNLTRIDDYMGLTIPISFKCSCGKIQKILPKSIFHGKSKCDDCVKRYGKHNGKHEYCPIYTKDDVQHIFDTNNIGLIVVGEYKNSNTPISVVCKNCGSTTKVLLSNTLKRNGLFKNTCAKCRYTYMTGENNPFYNPNLSEADRIKGRKYSEYREFIKNVLERDNYTCFITNVRGGDLEVHHINGYAHDINGRTDINNGVTLSKEMHKLYHHIYGFKNANRKDFEEFCKKYKVIS